MVAGGLSETGRCPSCGAGGMSIFYRSGDVPVHSVVLLSTREEAMRFPVGELRLGLCPACGFIANVAFDPRLQDYSSEYESTQSCSPTFVEFHRRLAEHLVERYGLHDKEIIEIGCGQGEFLTLLCELGNNRGVGFDPAYVEPSGQRTGPARIRFIKDYYSEKYTDYRADFVCCKMTLEHIFNTAEFVGTVRRSLGERFDTVVFFQVPDVMRILREQAFWDIYYEHCSYFSLGSLARLFRRCGFDVVDLWRDYDDQYLMIEARPGRGEPSHPLAVEEPPGEVAQAVAQFSEALRSRLDTWQRDLQAFKRDGRRVVLWGGGSKAVAFLTTLGLRDAVEFVVDINPRKHGTYLARTGQEVVAPEFLRTYRPDLVIVMNPVYCEEIRHTLGQMGQAPEMRAV